jgi:hypothetical protein
MISKKRHVIASLKAAIIAKGDVHLTINCARWDTILNLTYGSTKLHIAAAANLAGFDAIVGLDLAELKYRTAI